MTFRLFLILFMALSSMAQDDTNAPPPPPNYAVKFYGANTNSIPQFYPAQMASIGTNSAVSDGWFLFTQAQLDDLIATNAAAFRVANSNMLVSARTRQDADLADFLAKMDKLNVWIDRTSGTNSLSNAQRDSAINDICQTFKKLRRALVNLYKPE